MTPLRLVPIVLVPVLLVVGAIGAVLDAAGAGGSPKLQTGKLYSVIYQCQTAPVVTSQGVGLVEGCYAETWRILDVGKDGWVRFEDVAEGIEWYGNVSKLSAIREYVPKPAAPAPTSERFRLE